jgi:hypothetical protein
MQEPGEICEFSLVRLVETSLVNVTRVDIFWKMIVAHFDILFQTNNPEVRQLTIEALQIIVLEVFN